MLVRIRAVLHVRLPLHRRSALAGGGTPAAFRVASARRLAASPRWRSSRSKWRGRNGPILLRLAAGAYAAGWLWLAFLFYRLIRASNAEDKLHATLVSGALCVGASVVAAFALFGPAAHGWVKGAGLWGFLLPVFVTVCHRMIPFFTASVVPFVTAFRPSWLLVALIGAPVAHGVLEGHGTDAWTWFVDVPVAALMLWLTFRWGLMQSLPIGCSRCCTSASSGTASASCWPARTRCWRWQASRDSAGAAARAGNRLRVVAADGDGHARDLRPLRQDARRRRC